MFQHLSAPTLHQTLHTTNGDDVLRCPGVKHVHAQTVQVVYVEQPAPHSLARVRSNTGH
jgi:hypothetical protein